MKMKTIILTVLLAGLAVVAGWGLFLKSPQPAGHAANHEHRKDFYYCPMHPQIQSDKPGTCPICLMTLVKKESSDKMSSETTDTSIPGYSAISINSKKQQLIGVKTTAVEKKTLTKTIRAYGYVAHDLELYDAELEYIDAWRAFYPFLFRRQVTDTYRQDWRQSYLKPSSSDRWRSEEKIKAQQRFLKAEYEVLHMGLTETDLKQLREIKYGQPWVRPELLFFEQDNPVWIYGQVLEDDLGFVAPGQKVVVTIPAYRKTTEGIVRSVAPIVDPVTRTSRVRIELPNYQGELNVNLYADLEMPVELDRSLVIPREAIMDTGLSKIVFVQTHEGIFTPRTIQTGFEGNGMVAVHSGLAEGETIVVSGNFLLDSESRLQAVLDDSNSGGGHVHGQ